MTVFHNHSVSLTSISFTAFETENVLSLSWSKITIGGEWGKVVAVKVNVLWMQNKTGLAYWYVAWFVRWSIHWQFQFTFLFKRTGLWQTLHPLVPLFRVQGSKRFLKQVQWSKWYWRFCVCVCVCVWSVLPVHCKGAHQADEVMCCWGHLLFGCFLPWTLISTPSVPVFFTACQTVMKFCVKCFESIFYLAKWHFKKQFHYYDRIWNDSPYIS